MLQLNNSTLTSITIAKGTKFTTQIDGTTYAFVVNADQTITPVNGVLRFSNLPVYEGSLVTAKYTVDSSNIEKRYMVTDNRADTTTLKVSVQNSASDVTTTSIYSCNRYHTGNRYIKCLLSYRKLMMVSLKFTLVMM